MVCTVKNKQINRLYFLKDLSFWSLLATNIFVIYLAISQHWGFFDVFLSIWLQTIIIGRFNNVKFNQFKKNYPEEFKKRSKSAYDSLFMYTFVPMLYMFFIVVLYLAIGLTDGGNFMRINIYALIISSLSFFINHLFSYLYSNTGKLNQKYFSDQVYLSGSRVMPMHFTVMLAITLMIFTGTSLFKSVGLSFFILALKALIDVAMHINAHKKDPRHLSGIEDIKTGRDGIYGYRLRKVLMVVLMIVIAGFMLFTLFNVLAVFSLPFSY